MSGGDVRGDVEALAEVLLHETHRLGVGDFETQDADRCAAAVLDSPAFAAILRAERAAAWDEGYDTGYEDAIFDQRGLSTDSDAGEFPHHNPHTEAR